MNKQIKFCLLLTGLLLAGNSIAGDHGPGQDRMHQRSGPGMATPIIQHLARAIRRLDLSDDQKDSIHAEFKGLKSTLKPLVQELHESKKDLHGLITASEYDAEAVAINAERQGSLMAEITIIASEVAAAVLAQLSDAQRAELEAMGEDRRGHREAHHQRVREHREPRDPGGA